MILNAAEAASFKPKPSRRLAGNYTGSTAFWGGRQLSAIGPLPFPNSHRGLDIRLSHPEERTRVGERSFSISLFVELNFWSKVSFIHHYFEVDFTRKLV